MPPSLGWRLHAPATVPVACRVLSTVVLLLDVVLPVFAIVLIGAVVGRVFSLQVQPINKLSLYAVVPALAFRAMAGIEFAELNVGGLILAFGLFLVAMAIVGWVLGWRMGTMERRSFIGSIMLGNAANLNLPVALFAFGQAGLDRALILYVATALMMYGLGPALFGQAMKPARILRVVAGFPVLWATLAGLLVNASGVTLPMAASRAVNLLADAAIPLMLLILGIQLVRAGRWQPSGQTWLAISLKLIVAPLVALGIGSLLGLTGYDLAAVVLLGAMPTAVNTVMLAIEFEGDSQQLGETVAISTAAAVLTLPIVLMVFAGSL